MSPLFETIRLQDGILHNMEYHSDRLNKSRKELFGADDRLDLLLCIHIPAECKKGLFKCKVTYRLKMEEISFSAYQPRRIESLQLIADNAIRYNHKFVNRDHINRLYAQRGHCDDILLVKNGLIADTSFSNILFFDGIDWLTPASPLLPGTMRRHLLETKLVREKVITPADLPAYQKAMLINAMLPFDSSRILDTANIRF